MKAKILLFVLVCIGLASTTLLAQSVVITPAGTSTSKIIIEKDNSITFFVDQYGFKSCSNSFTYTWEVKDSKNNLITSATYTSQISTPSFTFPNVDVYTVSVAVTQNPGIATSACSTAVTKTATSIISVQNKVPEPNVFAASTLGSMISAYSIDKNGTITSGPYDYFDPFLNDASLSVLTAAMGRDKAGNFYYLPTPTTVGNGGNVEVWVKSGKGKEDPYVAATIDLNGSSTANVGLFRLGIDPQGNGWILAGDNTRIYLAKFEAKGKTISKLEIVDDNVTLPIGITPANFQSGDLAFSKNGTMYALAGSSKGTYIFTMKNQNTSNAELVTNWTLKTATGTDFNTMITGTIFDENGSMYFSALDGMYFVDHTTINSTGGQNTVRTKKIWSGSYLTDLSTNQFPDEALPPPPPPTPLPVKLTHFNGELNKTNTHLSWKTSLEENIQGFSIQRSLNGREFKDIAFLFSTGSGSEYNYKDAIPNSANIIYYRLKVHEIEGYTYSKIITVKADSKQQEVTIAPNPFQSSMHLTISSDIAEEMYYTIAEMDGKLIRKNSLKVAKGTNTFFLSDLANLKKGIYLLQLVSTSGSSSFRIIKD